MEVQGLTVGPFQENSFIVRKDGAQHAVIVDPGDEAPRLLGAIEQLGVTIDAILVTHCHIDHIGAVAAVATATGAPVYCPRDEAVALRNINDYVPWPDLGPFESWDPEHLLDGGEQLELAGLTIDVLLTPGHSPAHVTYAIPDEQALFSGDVLFQHSVGRVDLPGGDWPTLAASIQMLLDAFPDDTVVHPGHMGLTTLGAERAGNPFLAELT